VQEIFALAFFCPKSGFFRRKTTDIIIKLDRYLISDVLHLSFCGKIGQNVDFWNRMQRRPMGAYWTKQK